MPIFNLASTEERVETKKRIDAPEREVGVLTIGEKNTPGISPSLDTE